MEEHAIEVPRTARYYTLGSPGEVTDDVWFVLHGYRQLAGRFLHRFRVLEDPRRVIVAPEALSRFYIETEPRRHGPESRVGATWMTREARDAEIRDYVRYLDRVAARVLSETGEEGVRTTVLGFSQGLHTAARWAVLGEHLPDRLILWGDYLPPDLDMERAAERLEGVDVVFVVGERDPVRRAELARDQEARLERWRIAHRTRVHDGGHELEPDLLREIAAP